MPTVPYTHPAPLSYSISLSFFSHSFFYSFCCIFLGRAKRFPQLSKSPNPTPSPPLPVYHTLFLSFFLSFTSFCLVSTARFCLPLFPLFDFSSYRPLLFSLTDPWQRLTSHDPIYAQIPATHPDTKHGKSGSTTVWLMSFTESRETERYSFYTQLCLNEI